MNALKSLMLFTPCLLVACGGSGGSSDTASPASTGEDTASTPIVSASQQQINANIQEFSQLTQARQSGSSDNLTGIWIEVAGDIRHESGTEDGESVSGESVENLYRVHFVSDNGTTVDVSDCSTTLTLHTLQYNDSGQLVWRSFKGENKPVGTVTDNRMIDFGTTAYQYPRITANADLTISGDYSSRWMKLSNDLDDSIGSLSGYGQRKPIRCTSLSSTDGSLNDEDVARYNALFRDASGDWLTTDQTSGNAAPVRDGTRFTMVYDSATVHFNLD